MYEPIVSAEWLNDNLENPNLIILDASQRNTILGISSDFEHLQIIGARVFDLKGDFSLKSTNLPNMLPTAEQFEKGCRNLGINKSSKIIVYDNLGTHFSPRVWWMFRAMGHKEVFVLNGGLPSWIHKGFATETKTIKQYPAGNFCVSFNKNYVINFDFIEKNIDKKESLLIDARPSNRFNGTAPEPRDGIESGHIQNSINIPFDTVLENGKFKNKEELDRLFTDSKTDHRPLIFSCGSGVTACIVLLACELVRENEKSLYDGSWTEWAERTQAASEKNADAKNKITVSKNMNNTNQK